MGDTTSAAEASGRSRPESVTTTDPATMRRALAASAIGNITEWFDFGVYGYLATTIEAQFYPPGHPTLSQLGVFATYAVSFLFRPLGGLFFGPLADRIGRTRTLSLTIVLMGFGTFCIGWIPAYAEIGVAAPILLVGARIVQGFSTGGEYASAMTFVAEYSPDRRRGYFGSFLESGSLVGFAFGATLASVIPLIATEQFMSGWGWRIPFLVALPLGIAGLYLRLRIEDTPAFQNLIAESEQREGTKPKQAFREIFTQYWPVLFAAGGIAVVWNVPNYMLTSYMPTYLAHDVPEVGGVGISSTTSGWLEVAVLWACVAIIPLLGRLSDRVGRKPIMWTGSAGLIVLGIPIALLVQSGSVPAVLGGLVVMALLLVCFSATGPSTLPALFPTEIRCGGLSTAYNIFVSAFAGTVSLVMTALVLGTGDLNWPGYYLIAAGVVGVVTVWRLSETARRPLPGAEPVADAPEKVSEYGTAR